MKKSKKKTTKRRTKGFIHESLREFMPGVSRMGGVNPVDWGWGNSSKIHTLQGQTKKIA